jgi:hypothetical protein
MRVRISPWAPSALPLAAIIRLKVAKDAERDVEANKADYEQAEKSGRSHRKGELRKDLTGEDFNKK